MDDSLKFIQSVVFEKCALVLTAFNTEDQSKEYAACRFQLNGLNVVCRTSKITPKKTGQFVTFWKRNENGITEPLHESDPINFYAVNAKKGQRLGQFVFPKSILIQKGILSTNQKDGKRGFRIYPSWDQPQNKQAINTQNWQLDYFYEVNEVTELGRVRKLYQVD